MFDPRDDDKGSYPWSVHIFYVSQHILRKNYDSMEWLRTKPPGDITLNNQSFSVQSWMASGLGNVLPGGH